MKNARRFLVSPCIARLIARERGVDRQVVEGYLSSQPGKDQFIRLEANQAHFVLSGEDPAGDLVEKLAPLPREHAEALFGLCMGQISYDRLHMPPQSGLLLPAPGKLITGDAAFWSSNPISKPRQLGQRKSLSRWGVRGLNSLEVRGGTRIFVAV